MAGAAVSPQGEPFEPRPPSTAWSAATDPPGRAPGLWVLADRPVVAAADGLTAFDPSTGDVAWTVPLEDPACTVTDQVLTCVHGEGESASIATIDAAGDVTEQPFPDADVAVSAGDDLIVAGGTAGESPWFGRFTISGASAPESVWQYSDEFFSGPRTRWHDATISQGIVTIASEAGEAVVDSEGQFDARTGLAADLETGEPRPAVIRTARGSGVSFVSDVGDEWGRVVLPVPGPEPAVPGYPDAVFTGRGTFDQHGGDRILEYVGEPVGAFDDDVVIVGPHPDHPTTLEPGEEVELATRTERLDVRTGEAQWQLDRDQLVGCPCASSSDTMVLTGSVITDVDRFTVSPATLLGIDPGTGRHHWSLPISTPPDAIAAGSEHIYVLTGSTLTAYDDR